ncbi:hypothetical protein B0H13DRAFT_1954219 [Mycena leptocephala]|nr:hypothetical protein B0H13DRAFT_1954219 [Mycena leptocephala]
MQVLVLLAFAFLVIAAPVDLPEHEARNLNTEIIVQREVAPAPAVAAATQSLVDSENTGWTVDGNNAGWTVDGNNYNWHIKAADDMSASATTV